MEDAPTIVASGSAALVLAAVHLLAGRLVFLRGIPRSRWLSAAAGVSVAYVFVHLLPELSAAREEVGEEVFVLALAGLALFYAVEQHTLASRRETGRSSDAAFRLSMASFAVYNAIIGYLLVHGDHDLVLFAAALAIHFVVNDFGLREHHQDAYDRIGRWLLAGAVLVGWAAGQVAEVSESVLGLLIAFIGGGVILNVMKEELPGERQARLLPFLVGAAAYAALLLAA